MSSKKILVLNPNGTNIYDQVTLDVAKNSSYIELFGKQAATTLSFYKHDHDHVHNQDGSVSKWY